MVDGGWQKPAVVLDELPVDGVLGASLLWRWHVNGRQLEPWPAANRHGRR